MSTGKNLAGAAAYTLALKLFGATSGLVVTIFLTRLLSAEDVGYFFIAHSTAVFFALIARVGMKQPVVRLVSTALVTGNPLEISKGLTGVLVVVTLGCLVVLAFIWLGGGAWVFNDIFSARPIYSALAIWSILVFAFAFQVPVAETYRGLDRAPEAMLFDGPLGNMLLLISLVLLGAMGWAIDLKAALWLFAFVVLISLLIASIRLFGVIGCLSTDVPFHFIGSLLQRALPIYIVNITTFVATQSGLWICGALLSATDAAVFGSVMRLMLVVSLPLFILNMVIQSTIVQLETQKRSEELQERLRSATTFAAICSLIATTVAMLLANQILTVVFGHGYAVGASALRVLALSAFISVWAGPCLNFLMLTGHSRTASILVMSVSVATFVGSLILAQEFGVTGVAIATALGAITQNVLAWRFVRRLAKINTSAYSSQSELAGFFRKVRPFIDSLHSR